MQSLYRDVARNAYQARSMEESGHSHGVSVRADSYAMAMKTPPHDGTVLEKQNSSKKISTHGSLSRPADKVIIAIAVKLLTKLSEY